MIHKYPYKWTLKDAVFTKDKGKVFSCFACGGGSTMGYKLAGFDVIGCNEIDPKMMACYIANHNPKYHYLEPIQTFKLRDDLPEELYNLDILDGSPPCSSFSISGNREKDWGKEKKFKEGQAEQVLDTLFFDFIALAKKLQPKIIIAENVKGLLIGEAKQYMKLIISAFIDAGYRVDYKLLDASKMGVPQRRERVFFYAVRNDIQCDTVDLFGEQPMINLTFNEPKICFGEFVKYDGKPLTDYKKIAWDHRKLGDLNVIKGKLRAGQKPTDFNCAYLYNDKPMPTICAKGAHATILFNKPLMASEYEFQCGGSFPSDYNYVGQYPGYLIGMSVPPLMMAQIASRIYEQWLK